MVRTINNIQFLNLTKIYNNLMTISTKGTDTIVFGQCLSLLYSILNELNTVVEEETVNITLPEGISVQEEKEVK